jgi:putative AdoMet-dependent methyltransferase
MYIHQIAKRLNMTTRSIRFYEQIGLIRIRKQANGYRVFDENDAWRLQTIAALREVGMSIEDIRSVLDQFDAGSEHIVLDYLELQRSTMYERWVELRQMIKTIDRMIDSCCCQKDGSNPQDETLNWQHIFELAEVSRKVRATRESWRDRWNFDEQARTYDEQVRSTLTDKKEVLTCGQDGKLHFHIHAGYEEALDGTVRMVAPQPHELGLDIGTGTGNLVGRFLPFGTTMKAVDQSREMLQHCSGKHPTVETKLGHFLAIPYQDAQFDFIVTSYALHHLTEEQKAYALEEMERVLLPQGRLCVTDLMFVDQAAREAYLHMLDKRGAGHIIEQIEDEYYADRSQLLRWLKERSFKVKVRQWNELLHSVYAERTNL